MYIQPFTKQQILKDSPKPKAFADDNFKLIFYENGRRFSIWVENTVGKRRNCSLRAISPFPTVFSKDLYCRHIKTRACLTHYHTMPHLDALQICNWEQHCNKQFFLFSQCFLYYMALILHFICTSKMLSAICFNLDQSKILSSGNGLRKG